MQLITLLPQSLQQLLSVIAGLLLVAASVSYIISILTKDTEKRITPRPLSWFGWALMMGISVISQVISDGLEWNQIGLFASTFFCILIPVVTLVVRRYSIKPMDWVCLVLGLICIGVYLSTRNALLTTCLAIIADFIVAIPTLHNAYVDPKSEKTSAWLYGVLSWSLTLIVCIGNVWVYALFPLYLFVLNGTMIILTHRKVSTAS